MGLSQTTAPTCEPLTLVEAKAQCRYEGDDDNSLILDYIRGAREYVEGVTGRQLINASWTWTLDGFPNNGDPLYLPCNPLSSITSIQYIDTAGATQTWSSGDYDVDTTSVIGRVMPAYGETYPVTRSDIDAVTIIFVAGYGTSTKDVPPGDRQAIRLLVGHWFVNREAVLVGVTSKPIELALKNLLWINRAEIV